MATKKPSIINITATPSRGTDSSFTELQPKANIGPVPVLPPNTSLEDNARPLPPVETVATWKVMDKFDEGLKKAIIDFIDTTKEGVKAPNTRGGRNKILTFNFYGTGTKSIKPGEIGEFTITFSYPPGATSSTSTTSTVTNVSVTNQTNISTT
jgi:hypothetical protein